MMLKVAFVTNEFYPVWGGVSAYCINLCRGLADQVELHVFTAIKDESDLKPLLKSYPSLKSVKFHSLVASHTGLYSTLKFQLSGLVRLNRLIKENKIDIMHTSTFLSDAFYRYAGINVPNILTVHTTINGQLNGFLKKGTKIKDLDHSEWLTLGAYPLLRMGEMASLNRAPNIIAVSNSVANELNEKLHYRGSSHVIYNGVDLEVFYPRHELFVQRKRILFTGRIIARKGIETLVHAIPMVIAEHPDAFFVFAGAGRYGPYIELMRELGISKNNYEFVSVSYEQMGGLYRDSSIYVLPSHYESYPMSILEAAASGLPIVSTNIEAISSLVNHGKNGFLISPGDHKALAGYINQLLNNEDMLQKMGAASRQIAEESFSYSKMAIKTLEVYKKVLGSYESCAN
jgi:glycosyltransferase involved in cell wall biosynthesis